MDGSGPVEAPCVARTVEAHGIRITLIVVNHETAYAHGSGRESLPPDVEVGVRAGERVECSLYVPADGATT